MESILTSTKKLLGITEEYEQFDTDLIICINSVLSILTQLGVGPSKGFSIKDKTAVWTDFIPYDNRLEFVKSYLHLKVKLLFDPPLGSAVTESINRMLSELEWRINIEADTAQKGEQREQYNYEVGRYTHIFLNGYTHTQIREQAI